MFTAELILDISLSIACPTLMNNSVVIANHVDRIWENESFQDIEFQNTKSMWRDRNYKTRNKFVKWCYYRCMQNEVDKNVDFAKYGEISFLI